MRVYFCTLDSILSSVTHYFLQFNSVLIIIDLVLVLVLGLECLVLVLGCLVLVLDLEGQVLVNITATQCIACELGIYSTSAFLSVLSVTVKTAKRIRLSPLPRHFRLLVSNIVAKF